MSVRHGIYICFCQNWQVAIASSADTTVGLVRRRCDALHSTLLSGFWFYFSWQLYQFEAATQVRQYKRRMWFMNSLWIGASWSWIVPPKTFLFWDVFLTFPPLHLNYAGWKVRPSAEKFRTVTHDHSRIYFDRFLFPASCLQWHWETDQNSFQSQVFVCLVHSPSSRFSNQISFCNLSHRSHYTPACDLSSSFPPFLDVVIYYGPMCAATFKSAERARSAFLICRRYLIFPSALGCSDDTVFEATVQISRSSQRDRAAVALF